MNCPKCGEEVKKSDIECPKCGIIFEKYLAIQKRNQEKLESEKIIKEQAGQKNGNKRRSVSFFTKPVFLLGCSFIAFIFGLVLYPYAESILTNKAKNKTKISTTLGISYIDLDCGDDTKTTVEYRIAPKNLTENDKKKLTDRMMPFKINLKGKNYCKYTYSWKPKKIFVYKTADGLISGEIIGSAENSYGARSELQVFFNISGDDIILNKAKNKAKINRDLGISYIDLDCGDDTKTTVKYWLMPENLTENDKKKLTDRMMPFKINLKGKNACKNTYSWKPKKIFVYKTADGLISGTISGSAENSYGARSEVTVLFNIIGDDIIVTATM